MLKKIKKYFLLIPLIMVLCFNVCVYGSVKAVDYSSYFHNLDELNLPSEYRDGIFPGTLSTVFYPLNIINGKRNYFFVAVYFDDTNYDYFKNGSNFEFRLLVFDFYDDNIVPIYENDSFIRYHGFKDIRRWVFSYDASTAKYVRTVVDLDPSTLDLVYFKDSGQFIFVSYDTQNSSISPTYRPIFYVDTNVPNFPIIDYNFDSSFDVDVVFSPELTGAFNRTVSDRGQKVTLDDFSFKVSNNSNFDIQYLMAIYRESDTFLPFNTDPLVAKYDSNFNGKTYNGSPVYVYVKDEWLYLPHRQNGVITGYAPSSWHMVSAGDSDFVTINFNQIKLNTFQNYNVVVYAIRNDLSYVTPFTNLHEFQVPACADYNVDLDTLQLVYSSQFSILNPAEFDATNNENSYAFDENDRLLFNRANGYIDENGEMVIDRVDTNQWVTEGSDDPWVNFDSDLNAWDTYYKNQNTVSSDIDQLSRNFSSFFKFVNKFFSYFPKNYQSIIILGLTSMVVLGLFKVLI